MTEYGRILDVTARLGKEMLQCGANLERVNLMMTRVLHSYQLHNIAINTLSTNITISGTDPEGNPHIRQIRVEPPSIDLEKMKKLNALCFDAVEQSLPIDEVASRFKEIKALSASPWYITLIGFVIAMACLCRMFGGTWSEILVAEINTVFLFFASRFLGKLKLNRIIPSFAMMFIVTSIALFFTWIGFTPTFYNVIITCAFFLINGIGLVNSVRNILCGNEMNGIIEFIKVALEMVSIAAGLAAAFFLFGGWYSASLEESMYVATNDFLHNSELVMLSILASVGFGMVFGIRPKELVFAGLGGALVRIVYLALMTAFPEYRIVYASIAAFSAALYAEILANIRKQPATLFLYPSIVPLIPGDLFYYAALGLVWSKHDLFAQNALNCILQLVSISVGFVICSTIVFLFRKMKVHRVLLVFEHMIPAKKNDSGKPEDHPEGK